MGALADIGKSVGGAFAAGSGTAAGAASNSMGYGALATGLSAGGDIATGIGGLQQGLFAAHIARQNAQAALIAGQSAEVSSKLKYGALEGEQKAAQAANGIQVSSGSAEAVRHSTEELGALDAAMIHYNASRAAYGERAQAGLDVAGGRGLLGKGLIGAGNTFLGGANSLADKWLSYRLSGAATVPSAP